MLMVYLIISDNNFFLQGARDILNAASDFDRKKVIINNVSVNGLAVVKNSILKHRPKKIILNMNCIHKRRALLRLAGSFNLPVLLMSDIHKGDCTYGDNITLISCLCTRATFLREILRNDGCPTFKLPTPLSQLIIRKLSAGGSIVSVSENLGIDPKRIYLMKNNAIRRMGISTTKTQGMLLCRDILEMKITGEAYD